MADTEGQLRSQWANPGDIMSLLLLLGGDIVQKAIAQLVGSEVRFPGSSIRLSITPVAFSFGWVAYSFSNLLAAFGDMKLMPSTESRSLLVNCFNGFVRENHSWVLGRLLRDHELRHDIDSRGEEVDGRGESIRIDIFKLGSVTTPNHDFVWLLGWVIILVQIIVSVVPWIAYGHWSILMVTMCGILLAIITCAMPQWTQEKWPAAKLTRDKITCLTRGNGHRHILVFIGSSGSWDLEILATGRPLPRPETRWISSILTILWTCLLVSVIGIKRHTWYLVGIGGIGMLHNLFAAATPRNPAAANFHITKFSRAPTIIGRRTPYEDDGDSDGDIEEAESSLAASASWASQSPQTPASAARDHPMPQWLVSMSREDGVPVWLEAVKPQRVARVTTSSTALSGLLATNQFLTGPSAVQENIIYAAGVHGALIELEKWVPTAGLAMVQIFFPQGLVYNNAAIRDNVHKRFWKRAYSTRKIRTRVEKRRSHEQGLPAPAEVPASC